MAFEQGKYGVLHDPRRSRREASGGGRWIVACLVLLVLIGMGFAVRRHLKAEDDESPEPVEPPPPIVVAERPSPPVPPSKPLRNAAGGSSASTAAPRVTLPPPQTRTPSVSPLPPKKASIPDWLENALTSAETRPSMERQQLDRLVTALRENKRAVAIDAIERLYGQPTMADLQQRLVNQLGRLNMERLLSETNTPWTIQAVIRRGDTLERLSREHRTTLAATRKLNRGLDPDRIQIGQKVKLLNYPNAALVVHKKLEYADLFLKNGRKLFKRYYLRIDPQTTPGVYPVTGEAGATAAAIFSKFELQPVANDAHRASDARRELEMFLGVGSRITVSDQ